jgi:hypothetical protein
LALAALLFLLFTAPAWAIGTTPPSWKPRESVAMSGDTSFMLGADRSLAYDHHGDPGIAFSNDGSLFYARRVPGIGWTSAAIDGGMQPSLAYDRYERPAISYFDFATSSLGYARFNGSVWLLETADPAAFAGFHSALAFDRLGRPAAAYLDGGVGTLKFVQDTDGDLSLADETPVTLFSGAGEFPSLVFDPLNRPMIAHYGATDLRFSVWDPGVGWVTTAVDSTGNTGRYPSLAIDPDNGFPAIAYYSSSGPGELRYTAWDGDSWNQTTLDTTGAIATAPLSQSSLSLAFDPADGNPAIAYWNNTGGKDLKLAWHDGSIWQTQTVDAVGDVGRNPSLAFNDFGTGFPSIAYSDFTYDPDTDTYTSQLFFIDDPPATLPEPPNMMLLMSGALAWFASIGVRRSRYLNENDHES